LQVDLTAEAGVTALDCLFAEEGGVVLEVDPINLADVLAAFNNAGVPAAAVGKVTAGMGVSIKVNGKVSGPPTLVRPGVRHQSAGVGTVCWYWYAQLVLV
jgi:hypothetical protein